MARYNYTPKKWCTSATKLIYTPNKTDPHNLSNYTPIALMNCILKLWTSILASIGTQTTESEGVFGDTADEFRSHRNLYDSLSTHIMMYEDAKKIQNETYTQTTRISRVPSAEWTTKYSSNSRKNMDSKTTTLQRAKNYILPPTHTK